MDLFSDYKNRLVLLWAGLLIILLPCFVFAEPTQPTAGVVISIRGEVYERNEKGQTWKQLKAGSELMRSSVFNLRPDSKIKILTESGQMIKLTGAGQVYYSKLLTNRSNESGFLETLKILFSTKERRKIPSVRDLDQAYLEWINLLTRKDPRQIDLEKLFELMALFEELNYKNRILSLSALLTKIYPDNPIYACLKQSLAKDINGKVTWEIILNSEQVTGSKKTIPIQFNDRLQFAYHSELESYLYLFLSSYSLKQSPETVILFPGFDETASYSAGEFGLTARVNPSVGLILPAPHRAYKVDQKKGDEIIWGWSCHEPILDKNSLQNQRRLVEQVIKNHIPLPMDNHNIDPPADCHTFFIQHFKHR
ncbi:MAG: hypothetical protein MJE63_25000 [Proteobacteria bacterium]|nr:hypothetical protein [Pseudomonadota bacterium]